MGWWGVILALALPWLAGTLWVRQLWRTPVSRPGHWPLVLGYGYCLGLLGVTLLLRLQDALGLPLDAGWLLTILALLAAAPLLRGPRLAWRGGAHDAGGDAGVGGTRLERSDPRAAPWARPLIALLLLWLLVRLIGLALEVWWQPLFPWDAWTTWALRARAWLELGQLTPFVPPADWLAAPAGDAQALAAWHYPLTVSLLALWPVLAFGAWHETVANLPWVGCLLALGLGFYGQARRWGASPLTATTFLWLLGSLPLLNTHVALAGYADLWLAACLGLGAMALLHWLRDGDRGQGWLALLLLAACPLIKSEGAVWLLTIALAVLAAWARPAWWRRAILPALALGVGLGLAWRFAGGFVLELPGGATLALTPGRIELPLLGHFHLTWHNSLRPVLINLFVLDNWHLFGYLLVLALAWALADAARRGASGWRLAALVQVLSSLLALFVLFFMTDAWRWAEAYTSINRLLLHFVPFQAFWMLTLWLDSGWTRGRHPDLVPLRLRQQDKPASAAGFRQE